MVLCFLKKSFLSSCLWRFHRFRAAFCIEYFGLVEFKVMCICYGDESHQRGDRCKQRVERNGQVTRPGVDRWADVCKPGILPSRWEHPLCSWCLLQVSFARHCFSSFYRVASCIQYYIIRYHDIMRMCAMPIIPRCGQLLPALRLLSEFLGNFPISAGLTASSWAQAVLILLEI